MKRRLVKLKNKKDLLIDLPGIYTVSPLSKDEAVVSHFFLHDHVDKILNILDASQLKRNLHLTIQILEYGKPVVIGLNMMDVAKGRGIEVDVNKLSSYLRVPVVPIIARSGEGCDELSQTITSQQHSYSEINLIYYGREIEEAALKLENLLPDSIAFSSRWLTLQFLEGNHSIKSYLMNFIEEDILNKLVLELEESLKFEYRIKSIDEYIYNVRSEFINKILEGSIVKSKNQKVPFTDKVDRLVTNRFLGIPIFLLLMYLMFMLTFDWLGFPLSDILDSFITGPLTSGIESFLAFAGASAFIHDLIIDGIVAGVGGVLVFVPQIFILFFFISVLEDSGYMARVALVMDRIMEGIGLNGKAFIPMIIGFGCNVPGIMAARTIETPRERLLTVLLTPLMSCSARLPVYALFVGAFFVQYKALVVLSLYVLGIVLALGLSKLFSSTILKGDHSLFVIELPPYRVPQRKALWRSTWDKGKGFIRKAGTFIFAGSVIIWLFAYIGPSGWNVDMDHSLLAAIGGIFAPFLAPLGFGTWQAGASLITGFLAKESIISSMNIIYFVQDQDSLQGLLTTQFSPLAAISFMVFILIYIPCLATTEPFIKKRIRKNGQPLL